MDGLTCPPADFYVQPAFCSNNPPTLWHPPLIDDRLIPGDVLVLTGSGLPVEWIIVGAVMLSIGALLTWRRYAR